jgi:hypothetical protein
VLTWMRCADGRQTARATPFRDKGRIVEIGGWYCIEPFDVEGQRCFRLSYYPTQGEVAELGTASTLGDARVQAEEHYFDQRVRALRKPASGKSDEEQGPPA